jgi:hypothetical protein
MGEGMIASHIHDALAQVKRLQEVILSKQFFRGYSGKARIISGTIALAASAVMDSKHVPCIPEAHLAGWAIVLAAGLMVNYTALFYWFLFDPETRRNPIMLKPALDAIPALAVGGVLTVAMIRYDQCDMLFGVWMCLYGVAQTAYRQSLPRGIYFVGLGYIAAGAYCLVAESIYFLDPWPMGIVFFAGEWIGGIVLILNETKTTEEKR